MFPSVEIGHKHSPLVSAIAATEPSACSFLWARWRVVKRVKSQHNITAKSHAGYVFEVVRSLTCHNSILIPSFDNLSPHARQCGKRTIYKGLALFHRQIGYVDYDHAFYTLVVTEEAYAVVG